MEIKCLICKKTKVMFSKERQDRFQNGLNCIYRPPLEDSFITQIIKKVGREGIIEKEDGSLEFYICSLDQKDYQYQKNKWDLQKFRKKLRATKCSICQNFLLKEKNFYTCYYSFFKRELLNSETLTESEFESKSQIICWKCWEQNKYLVIEDNENRYIKTLVNIDQVVNFDEQGVKIFDLNFANNN